MITTRARRGVPRRGATACCGRGGDATSRSLGRRRSSLSTTRKLVSLVFKFDAHNEFSWKCDWLDLFAFKSTVVGSKYLIQ